MASSRPRFGPEHPADRAYLTAVERLGTAHPDAVRAGRTDGTSFSTGYTFDPATGNTAANARHLRLLFTANVGWSAVQVSEFQVYAS